MPVNCNHLCIVPVYIQKHGRQARRLCDRYDKLQHLPRKMSAAECLRKIELAEIKLSVPGIDGEKSGGFAVGTHPIILVSGRKLPQNGIRGLKFRDHILVLRRTDQGIKMPPDNAGGKRGKRFRLGRRNAFKQNPHGIVPPVNAIFSLHYKSCRRFPQCL